MSLEIDGFLSDKIVDVVKQHRAAYEQRFALAARLNRIAQRLLVGAIVPPEDHQLLFMLLFFARATSTYQGVVILAERGMITEAKILARSCLESSFFIGATANDRTFVEQLVSSNKAHKEKIAKWATSADPFLVELSAQQLADLNGFLDELKQSGEKPGQIIIRSAAKSANMDDLYRTMYGDLSNAAAHPSLDAVLGFLESDVEGRIVGLRAGPDAKDIDQALSVADTALFCALSLMFEKFPNEGCQEEMMACWEIHKQLGSEMVAESQGVDVQSLQSA